MCQKIKLKQPNFGPKIITEIGCGDKVIVFNITVNLSSCQKGQIFPAELIELYWAALNSCLFYFLLFLINLCVSENSCL